jgi:hypothetical protein
MAQAVRVRKFVERAFRKHGTVEIEHSTYPHEMCVDKLLRYMNSLNRANGGKSVFYSKDTSDE